MWANRSPITSVSYLVSRQSGNAVRDGRSGTMLSLNPIPEKLGVHSIRVTWIVTCFHD